MNKRRKTPRDLVGEGVEAHRVEAFQDLQRGVDLGRERLAFLRGRGGRRGDRLGALEPLARQLHQVLDSADVVDAERSDAGGGADPQHLAAVADLRRLELVAQAVSKDVADQILARVAKLVSGMLRTEDSIGRMADATFVVVSAGTGAPQVLAFAKRLRDQLEAAKVSYGGKVLKIRASTGVASLGIDDAATIEDLMKVGVQRLDRAAEPVAAHAAHAAVATPARPALPADVDAALRVLEGLDAVRLDQFADEIARRLAPLVQLALKLRQSGREKIAKLVG